MACSKCGGNGGTVLTFQTLVEKDGSILPTLKYVHCAYNEQFASKFKSIGIDVTDESRLKNLAWLSDTSNDVNGYVHDSKGNPIKFSVEEVLKSIDTSKPTKSNCSI